MSVFAIPEDNLPSMTVPADLNNSAQLSIYDGFPDPHGWTQAVLEHSRVHAHPKDYDQIAYLTPLETGAPIGSFMQEGYRVARAVGLISAQATTDATPGTAVSGACIAQGLCHVRWKQHETANFLVVEFSAPHAFGWGAGKSSLSQEHVKARCLYQYAHQARSLLENTHDCAQATAVIAEFTGEWGPETEYIRRGLVTTCILFWKAQVLQYQEECVSGFAVA